MFINHIINLTDLIIIFLSLTFLLLLIEFENQL